MVYDQWDYMTNRKLYDEILVVFYFLWNYPSWLIVYISKYEAKLTENIGKGVFSTKCGYESPWTRITMTMKQYNSGNNAWLIWTLSDKLEDQTRLKPRGRFWHFKKEGKDFIFWFSTMEGPKTWPKSLHIDLHK
jgi:hypothetical protein